MRYSNTMRSLILIAHNLRSTHNVGSLLRTAEGIGVEQVILTGYTPYPLKQDDPRLPHLSAKLHKAIHKTALGAETTQNWSYQEDVTGVIAALQNQGWTIAAVEQAVGSIELPRYTPADKVALLVGREVEGIEPELLTLTDITLEIPMAGSKESYNVAQAAAIALYHCRFAAVDTSQLT